MSKKIFKDWYEIMRELTGLSTVERVRDIFSISVLRIEEDYRTKFYIFVWFYIAEDLNYRTIFIEADNDESLAMESIYFLKDVASAWKDQGGKATD